MSTITVARMLKQLSRIAAWLSQGVNCIFFGGHHDQTLSARCYAQQVDPGWRVAYHVFNTVAFWQENHCLRSYQRDLDFAEELRSGLHR